jgi:hypothetical protein
MNGSYIIILQPYRTFEIDLGTMLHSKRWRAKVRKKFHQKSFI